VLAACPPPGIPREELAALRATGFEVAQQEARDAMAIALLDCVGDPQPALRDGLAYSALSTWLRSRQLSAATVHELTAGLLAQLRDTRDPGGFRRPFAALLLSEVAHADLVAVLLTAEERDAMVAAVVAYLRGLNDYRGFSDTEGWRHGVAHAADLIGQLSVNTEIAAPAVQRMMDALAAKVAPSAKVYYVHGEPGRLARAAYFTYRRGVLDTAYWARWINVVASPAPLRDWRAAYGSELGLARRHNALAFLHALAQAARTGGGATDASLLDAVDQALARVGTD
jgi:hypothetical protein